MHQLKQCATELLCLFHPSLQTRGSSKSGMSFSSGARMLSSRHQYMEDAVGPDGMNRIRAAVQEQEELEEKEFAEILMCQRCKRRRVLEQMRCDES